jgi:hypothetical protein
MAAMFSVTFLIEVPSSSSATVAPAAVVPTSIVLVVPLPITVTPSSVAPGPVAPFSISSVLPAAMFSVAFLIEVPSSSSATVAPDPVVPTSIVLVASVPMTVTPSSVAPGPVAPFSISSVLPAAMFRVLFLIEVPSSSSATVAPDAVVPTSIVLVAPAPTTVTPSSVAGTRRALFDIQRAPGGDVQCDVLDRGAVVQQRDRRTRRRGADIDRAGGVGSDDSDAVERRARTRRALLDVERAAGGNV